MSLLEVKQLKVWDSSTEQVLVANSSFQLAKGHCLAIVGESGSGKSLTCKAIMRLNQAKVQQSGSIVLDGVDLSLLNKRAMRGYRGKRICMIMQNGMRAFNPSRPVGAYLGEVLARHYDWSKEEKLTRIGAAMTSVGLKDPASVMRSYPYELSGGMLQRVMIALSIVMEPDVIIADEPTTALDAVTQFEVMEQLAKLRNRLDCAMIFVSHDLHAVKRIANDVLVMKDGEIIERGTAADFFTRARHPYTRQLITAKQSLSRQFNQLMGGASVAQG
ncbi:nickel transport system ATP-binding protein [Paenibacillus cellulosilyticus]|uniref:Nickel transport system ATP-binding protein n=1 Tax=Paenibacillus cellulosilyticus TaxID=375489 RepID=A0A2V2YR40_9BACL|nr:ABC transporter ATP-binding protein [Paenibacillus cellulosilyticus]PWV99350.1 nickel transport system ATP-binding protein [Paenibacillus cellulosilyticus]QKS45113.1 ABC transporter ATP-binding protein [Paenibacillus cellulosilyticus]